MVRKSRDTSALRLGDQLDAGADEQYADARS
jgi:hypothetical protein